MIRYLRHTEIDKAKWDSLIAASPHGMIYAYSWWLDIVCPGWEALVKEDYSALMPLTCRSRAGIRYLYQPAFTQQLGVFGKEAQDATMTGEFMAAIPEEFKLIEISLNTGNLLSDKNSETSTSQTFHLSLNRSAGELFKSYSENTRRNIKKAKEENPAFQSGLSASELLELYRSNQETKHGKLKSGEDVILEKLIAACTEKKCGISVGLKARDSKLKAGAFFVWSHKTLIFLFSATETAQQKIRWLPLLIDQCIAHDAGKDRILDFEGSDDEDLARFYRSFGAERVVYLRIRKNRLPIWLKWLK